MPTIWKTRNKRAQRGEKPAVEVGERAGRAAVKQAALESERDTRYKCVYVERGGGKACEHEKGSGVPVCAETDVPRRRWLANGLSRG